MNMIHWYERDTETIFRSYNGVVRQQIRIEINTKKRVPATDLNSSAGMACGIEGSK